MSRFFHTLNQARRICQKYKVFTYAGLLFLTITSYYQKHEIKMQNENIRLISIAYAEQKKMNEDLIANLVIYNRNYEDFPFATWQKVKRNDKFIAQYFNPAYVSEFGHEFEYNRFKYIGLTDFDIYPRKVAKRYYDNDLYVAVTGNPLIIGETYIDLDKQEKHISVLKWRQIERKDTLIYGMVLKTKF